MEKISRRKFTKGATLAVAAGSLAATAPKVFADNSKKKDSKYPVVLYRETDEWKRYYETLK
jgi:anaerobic selenocysteine-containing dehydrogenase